MRPCLRSVGVCLVDKLAQRPPQLGSSVQQSMETRSLRCNACQLDSLSLDSVVQQKYR